MTFYRISLKSYNAIPFSCSPIVKIGLLFFIDMPHIDCRYIDTNNTDITF